MSWFVYMVRCADGTLYTGISKEVTKRVATHNAGKGAKYTRSRLPVVLVWQESLISESAARKREYELKSYSRAKKHALFSS